MLPKDKLELITSILPPQDGVGVDTPGWRCSFLFGSDEEILEHILSRGNRIVGECSRTVALNSDPRQGQDRRSSWTRPRTGWIKVNVDASVSTVDRNGVGDKLAKRGRELGMKSTIFVAAPAAVAGLVEVEQRDSLAPTSAQGVADDLGGSNW
ncbi:hypothetical protein V6N13_010143 [Hibiscus sabdariffa]